MPMDLRLLGVHNTETDTTRLSCALVDGRLALDAGSLCRGLGLEEQVRLDAVLLTHRHFDHVKDVAGVGMAKRTAGASTPLVALAATHDGLAATLLEGTVWSRLYEKPDPAAPAWRRVDCTPGEPLDVAGYRVTPLAVPHSVPACGFLVERDGACLWFSGDTGPGMADGLLASGARPDLLVTEVTYSDAYHPRALEQGHLTPSLLAVELDRLETAWGALPQVVIVHRDPLEEAALRLQLEAISRGVGWDLLLPDAGDRLVVSPAG